MIYTGSVLMACLLAQLNHASYRGRHRAYTSLQRMGPAAVPALEWGRSAPNPEVRERCDRLLAPYAEGLADRDSHRIFPSRWKYLPWLECNETLRNALVGDACRLGYNHQAPDWTAYREATRLWVRAQLLQQRPRQWIVRQLDGMCWQEKWWIQSFGRSHGLPIPCDP